VAEPTGPEGATPPSGPDPASGAMPGGQQQQQEGATPPAGSGEGARPDPPLGDVGRQALDRERDARRDAERQRDELRHRIADLEDRDKSETERDKARLQRATFDIEQRDKRIAELEGEVAARDLRDLKAQIAAEEGLPPSVASRLQGTDVRSLRADAKSLRNELESGRPTGSLGIGVGGGATNQQGRVDMNTLIRQAAGRDG
jgi:hypothetical protein